jgi:hypothetical protein
MFSCCSLSRSPSSHDPSPMVEHTRAHPRLQQQPPPGRREPLELGSLFLPAGLKQPAAILFHFHGSGWIAEKGAASAGRTAVVSVEIGSGSSVYAKPFADPDLFSRLLAQAESKAGFKFSSVGLTAWSAGYGAYGRF